jgi:hypothetical protein
MPGHKKVPNFQPFFVKLGPFFVSPMLCQFTKYKNFI